MYVCVCVYTKTNKQSIPFNTFPVGCTSKVLVRLVIMVLRAAICKYRSI